jgi:hypothetical protein
LVDGGALMELHIFQKSSTGKPDYDIGVTFA